MRSSLARFKQIFVRLTVRGGAWIALLRRDAGRLWDRGFAVAGGDDLELNDAGMKPTNLGTDRAFENFARRTALGLLAAGGLGAALTAAAQTTPAETSLRWFDARELCVEGKGWADTSDFYDRLPAKAQGVVRPPVWNLSRDSAGMSVRFTTDATAISVRWTLRQASLAMSHMPASGVSGVDLYVRQRRGWRWVGAARPDKSVTTEKVLVSGLAAARHEFRLYLPLYNGVETVAIGVAAGKGVSPAEPATVKPIVFYGTSITQGGCASRPGMAYPAILGRRLDWPTINLGFSGNAHSEPELARLLAELDPAVYVLDPLPNMTGEMVATRLAPFVATLRQAHPRTPIVLVESVAFPAGALVIETRERVADKNARLREIYRALTRSGQQKLFYVPAGRLIGEDGDGTVDGVHPTDLGFVRMADALEPVLRRALKASR
jgi:lysophospholipase L1-like esterase